jgi:hypothetical protein
VGDLIDLKCHASSILLDVVAHVSRRVELVDDVSVEKASLCLIKEALDAGNHLFYFNLL